MLELFFSPSYGCRQVCATDQREYHKMSIKFLIRSKQIEKLDWLTPQDFYYILNLNRSNSTKVVEQLQYSHFIQLNLMLDNMVCYIIQNLSYTARTVNDVLFQCMLPACVDLYQLGQKPKWQHACTSQWVNTG